MSAEKKAALKTFLTETRQTLMDTLAGLDGDDWQMPVQTDGDQWTLVQMLRHLQDAEVGLGGQAMRLANGEPTVPRDFDVHRWNARIQRKTAEAEMTAEQALHILQKARQKLLAFIDDLPDEAWERTGYQSFLDQDLPLEDFIRVIGSHEAGHTAEIAAALARQKG